MKRRKPAVRKPPLVPKKVSGTPELLAAVLRGVPRLENPLCVKVPTVMDGCDDEAIALALAICRVCPALSQCRSWVASGQAGELSGVVAGERCTGQWIRAPQAIWGPNAT